MIGNLLHELHLLFLGQRSGSSRSIESAAVAFGSLARHKGDSDAKWQGKYGDTRLDYWILGIGVEIVDDARRIASLASGASNQHCGNQQHGDERERSVQTHGILLISEWQSANIA